MSKEKAQSFFAKKKEEAKGKVKEKERMKKEGDKAEKQDTSKMPEGLRKHFEKKGK